MNPFTLASGGLLRGDRYDLRKATMLDLIRIAYKVPPETILGGPNWLEFDRFDIAAKAPGDSSPEVVRLMLQSLLAERFHLAVHSEMRPMPAYALTPDRPKMRTSDGTGSPVCEYVPQPTGSTMDEYSCRNETMADFAFRLRSVASDYLQDPVVDATGLDGTWDFELRWNRRSRLLPAGTDRTTIFDALRKQLGLNLIPGDAPSAALVIDHVERPATNAPDVAKKLPRRELAFEVASLKLNKAGERSLFRAMRGGIEVTAMPLGSLMAFAWDMNTVHEGKRFVGMPKGVDSVYVDIVGKTTKNANAPGMNVASEFDDDLRAMTRVLLTERFKIKWHYEDRPVEAISLTAGKPKLTPADTTHRASCHQGRTIANDPRDVNPLLSQLISCRNVTMAQLASKLQEIDDFEFVYPVNDATGLKGSWDFDLSFTPGEQFLRSVGKTGADSLEPSGVVSLGEALGRLGLKLEKRRRMLPVIVIDHMELTPTAN